MPSLTIDTSCVGPVTFEEEQDRLIRLSFGNEGQKDTSPLLLETAHQLQAYFEGQLQDFDLPLNPKGTAFQQAVYRAMSAIPYGRTLSYGEIAAQVGSVARAVGGACGSNPIAIIIPCHRVLASGGRSGGFSGLGGVKTKHALLDLEQGTPRLFF